MASRGMLLQSLLLALALVCYVESVRGSAEGEEVMAAVAGVDEAYSSEPSSRSSFVSRRLAESKPEAGRATFLLTCQTYKCPLSLFPTCCPGLLNIGVLCVNTLLDPLNCGTCANKCPLGSICCSGKCANLLTDPNNCGICGKKCPTPYKCFLGLCEYNGKILLGAEN